MRRLADRSGQALIEMALILPILLMLVLGVISYGLYINAVDTVQEAARLAARSATIGDTMGCPGDSAQSQLASGSAPTVYGVVDDQLNGNRWLSPSLTPYSVSFAAVVGNQSNSQNNNIVVTVAVPYHPLIPIPGLLPTTMEIAQTYEMMVQNAQPSNAITTTEPTGSPYNESSSWTSPAPPTTNVSYLTQPGGC